MSKLVKGSKEWHEAKKAARAELDMRTFSSNVPAAAAEDNDTPAPGRMTKAEMKAALDEKGIEYPANATNDELKALLEA